MKAESKLFAPLLDWTCTSLMASRATTAGVSTTARAKLNASARDFGTPANMATEIVAPEREKPLNGRQRPCTAPIRPA